MSGRAATGMSGTAARPHQVGLGLLDRLTWLVLTRLVLLLVAHG